MHTLIKSVVVYLIAYGFQVFLLLRCVGHVRGMQEHTRVFSWPSSTNNVTLVGFELSFNFLLNYLDTIELILLTQWLRHHFCI